jgi:hypothetical protein
MNKLKKYYHVTFKSKLSNILYEGIKAGKKRIWSSMYGAKLGEQGLIYAHDDWESAVKWAYKQTWDMNKECLVVGYSYECVKIGNIEPEQIVDIYDVDARKYLH